MNRPQLSSWGNFCSNFSSFAFLFRIFVVFSNFFSASSRKVWHFLLSRSKCSLPSCLGQFMKEASLGMPKCGGIRTFYGTFFITFRFTRSKSGEKIEEAFFSLARMVLNRRGTDKRLRDDFLPLGEEMALGVDQRTIRKSSYY